MPPSGGTPDGGATDAISDTPVSCSDECSREGAQRCASEQAAHTCSRGADGCLRWSDPAACPAPQTCSLDYCAVHRAWTSAPPMPTLRPGFALVTGGDGRIYTIGGNVGAVASKIVEVYTPATNTWDTAPGLETGRLGLSAAALGNRLVAVGGFTGGQTAVSSAEALTLGTSWTAATAMLGQRGCLRAITGADGKVYAIGGRVETTPVLGPGNVFQYLSTAEVFDPATSQWTAIANMNVPRCSHALAATSDGKIYAIAGGNTGSNISTVEVYDPTANRWTLVTTIPPMLGTAGFRWRVAAATGPDDRVYVFGGSDLAGGSQVCISSVQIYTPGTNTWSTAPSMPSARCNALATRGLDGRIYVVGGSGSSAADPVYPTVEIYAP